MPTRKGFHNLAGRTFHRLTVVSFSGRTKRRRGYWLCVCTCGNYIHAETSSIKSGNTKSCGCLWRDAHFARRKLCRVTHHPLYVSWKAMVQRCSDPHLPEWKYYGGRGIAVCAGWKHFANYCVDIGNIGPKPSPQHSLDRINNDGHYSCGHCQQCVEAEWRMNLRWATKSEQNLNRRGCVVLTFGGKTMGIAQWSKSTGLPIGTIRTRLHDKWSVERALTQPHRSAYSAGHHNGVE